MKKGNLLLILTITAVLVISGCTSSTINNQQINCKPEWNCSNWSSCTRTGIAIGIQNRSCLDRNDCNLTLDKPIESQSCQLPVITSKEPSEIALQISDFPSSSTNWTLKERGERTKSDVSEETLSWGWEKGYHSIYYRLVSLIDSTSVEQFVSIYPSENISKTLSNRNTSFYNFYLNLTESAKKQNLTSADNGYVKLDDLSDPRIGDKSIAYRVKARADNKDYTIYAIEFRKMNVYQLIVMWGQTLDYELLKEIVNKSSQRIT